MLLSWTLEQPYQISVYFIGSVGKMSFLKAINSRRHSQSHNPALTQLNSPRKGTKLPSAFAVSSNQTRSNFSPLLQRSHSHAETKKSKFQQLQERFREVKARERRRMEQSGGWGRGQWEQNANEWMRSGNEMDQLSGNKVLYHVSYSNYIDSKMEMPVKKKAIIFTHLDHVARSMATPIKLEQKYLTPPPLSKSRHDIRSYQACLTEVQQDKDKYHTEENSQVRLETKHSQEQSRLSRTRPRGLWRQEVSEIVNKRSNKAIMPWGGNEDEYGPISHRQRRRMRYDRSEEFDNAF